MKKENENNTDQNASAFSVPNEILHFLRSYFLIEQENPGPELIARATLLTNTLIRFMFQLYRLGIEDEFQPVFFAANYVKPHPGDVTECKRTYEVISGEPNAVFNLNFLASEYEKAYKAWVEETFGVELSEKAAEILGQWRNVL